MQNKKNEIWVGMFIIISLLAVVFLSLRVVNIRSIRNPETYQISAFFDNIGGLKVHSPVRIGGVLIGRVADISLDLQTYTPKVTIEIEQTYNHIPDTSSLVIRTAGLLGEQYLSLNIGFDDPKISTSFLKNGSVIQDTKSAIVLEDLMGQFFYKNISNNNVIEMSYNSLSVPKKWCHFIPAKKFFRQLFEL